MLARVRARRDGRGLDFGFFAAVILANIASHLLLIQLFLSLIAAVRVHKLKVNPVRLGIVKHGFADIEYARIHLPALKISQLRLKTVRQQMIWIYKHRRPIAHRHIDVRHVSVDQKTTSHIACYAIVR